MLAAAILSSISYLPKPRLSSDGPINVLLRLPTASNEFIPIPWLPAILDLEHSHYGCFGIEHLSQVKADSSACWRAKAIGIHEIRRLLTIRRICTDDSCFWGEGTRRSLDNQIERGSKSAWGTYRESKVSNRESASSNEKWPLRTIEKSYGTQKSLCVLIY